MTTEEIRYFTGRREIYISKGVFPPQLHFDDNQSDRRILYKTTPCTIVIFLAYKRKEIPHSSCHYRQVIPSGLRRGIA